MKLKPFLTLAEDKEPSTVFNLKNKLLTYGNKDFSLSKFIECDPSLEFTLSGSHFLDPCNYFKDDDVTIEVVGNDSLQISNKEGDIFKTRGAFVYDRGLLIPNIRNVHRYAKPIDNRLMSAFYVCRDFMGSVRYDNKEDQVEKTVRQLIDTKQKNKEEIIKLDQLNMCHIRNGYMYTTNDISSCKYYLGEEYSFIDCSIKSKVLDVLLSKDLRYITSISFDNPYFYIVFEDGIIFMAQYYPFSLKDDYYLPISSVDTNSMRMFNLNPEWVNAVRFLNNYSDDRIYLTDRKMYTAKANTIFDFKISSPTNYEICYPCFILENVLKHAESLSLHRFPDRSYWAGANCCGIFTAMTSNRI